MPRWRIRTPAIDRLAREGGLERSTIIAFTSDRDAIGPRKRRKPPACGQGAFSASPPPRLAPGGASPPGRWKLLEWFDRSIGGAKDGPAFEWFDLEGNPGETLGRADWHSGVRYRMAEERSAWRRSIVSHEMTPSPDIIETTGAETAPPPPGDPGNPFGK